LLQQLAFVTPRNREATLLSLAAITIQTLVSGCRCFIWTCGAASDQTLLLCRC